MSTFFSNDPHKIIFNNLRKKLANYDLDGKEYLRDDLLHILELIKNHDVFWDDICEFNITHIGSQLMSQIDNLFHQDQQTEIELNIQSIYVMFYRFLCEANFKKTSNAQIAINVNNLITNIDDHIELFSMQLRSQIIYARTMMPAAILSDLLHHENLIEVKDFNKKIREITQLKTNWDNEISQKKQEVDNLKQSLDHYKTAFNFVGLYQGFENLYLSKSKELSWARWILATLGAASIMPVLIEIFLLMFRSKELFEYKELLLYAIFPTLTLQLILIYFFRVSLFNFKSIKAQLLQIELRKTLCQFIQNYSDFAKNMKSNDSVSLEKFESLIFSGLITNEENLPSTFDGIEQISKVLQSFKATNY